MNAPDVIKRLREILETHPGGKKPTVALQREIRVRLFELSRCDPGPSESDLRILKNRFAVVFSPGKHRNVQGGLNQARCNVLSSLKKIEWGWRDMKRPKSKPPRVTKSKAGRK